MTRNPYKEGTKYALMFELCSRDVIPNYPVLLKKVNDAFPGDHTTINALRRFKSLMRRNGFKVGRQSKTRTMSIPTPRQAADRMEAAPLRVKYAADLLTALGYGEAARWLRA